MICRFCGGRVIWMGRNFTYTECQNCGATNCQIVEESQSEDEEEE